MTFDNIPPLKIGGDREFILDGNMTYVTRAGEVITVPKGFITDLASIPRLFQWLIPVNGLHRCAAIVHDYLFVIQDRPREDADRIFLEAMEDCGVRWTQRQVMYRAVRAGGWLTWAKGAKAIREDRAAHYRANGLNHL